MIGLTLVGSAWPPAWLIVTVGTTLSQVTVLSVEVDAVLALPAASVATPAPMLATTVPGVVMPVTATLYVVPEPVTVATFGPPAVPVIVTSPVANVVVASLNTTVKLIGLMPVGSSWGETAWLMVTVGGVLSTTRAPARVNRTLGPAPQPAPL